MVLELLVGKTCAVYADKEIIKDIKLNSKIWDRLILTKACQVLEMMLEVPISLSFDFNEQSSLNSAVVLDILMSKGIAFLDCIKEDEEDLESLCNNIYNKELEDLSFAYKMSLLRRKIARFLQEKNENISETCFFNAFLDQLIDILTARGAQINAPIPIARQANISSKEEECVMHLLEYVKNSGWENIALGEREELLLCFCHYYYAKKEYITVSNLIMEVAESGVSDPMMYMAYFQSAVMCEEFEAAMEAYNEAVSARPILALLPTDRYAIKNMVATNMFENIYSGEDLYTKNRVIIKELKNAPEEVIEKINACHNLKHSKIFEILDVEKSSNKKIIISEYFVGQPLTRFITENGPLNIEKWKEVSMQILGAIAHAHDSCEIAHGYLSPDSIYFDGKNIKISNFGFCAGELWGEAIDIHNLDDVSYYAPEVIKSESLTLQSDVYSLGKILTYLLTGTTEGYFNQKIPNFLLKILSKSLQINPEKRYENAEEMLKSIVAGMQKEDTPNQKTNAIPIENKNTKQAVTLISDDGSKIILPDGFVMKNEQIYSVKDSCPMVFVSEGPFIMGSSERNSESPIHKVRLDHYLIDKYPVTNKQYSKFLHETSRIDLTKIVNEKQTKVNNFRPKNWGTSDYTNYSKKPNMPVVFVDWWDAWAYSCWAGKSLPSEAEWEKAARGNDERTYPWGNQPPTNSFANFAGNIGRTTAVESFPQAASPYGCLDMVGNVWEWCIDTYDPNFYQTKISENPVNKTEKPSRVLRGGSWNDAVSSIRTTVRGCWMNIVRYSYIGFRCVYRLDKDESGN